MNKKCVQGWASFLLCFLFVFLFVFHSLLATEIPSLSSRLIHLSATVFRTLWFLLFFCACYFSGVLNYGTLGKVRGVCYGAVGGLDIVENHGLHGVGLATL